ncbi:alpha/beta hydrolase [Rossellomorea vietnamensis]|uniref:Alpha/beta hydrolase n=1 Tax=Rossellomorea vietnamensis TaxID=218284 RepID=A0A5D4KC73_9BACI|nr:alpha/beta hydrolase-fold protein [Rossellomorea vietnamensis]TYR74556.1 alpha/beta hydrolase [Rossellomorea vietnamensis]
MYEQFNVKITPLNRDRTIRVYLPKGYERNADQRYPVLYMHDGQNLYRDEDAGYGMAWRVGDYLDESEFEMIVVGIDCNDGLKRLDEYAPWESSKMPEVFDETRATIGGEGQAYIEYIVHELKPFIDQKYRTKTSETSMAGSSMGGLISTYAACKYPHIFKRVASLSSAYWFNQEAIEELIRKSDMSAVERFYMDVGTAEVTETIDGETYERTSERVYDILKEKVENIRFDTIEGGVHNEISWRERLPQVFGYLFK